MAGTWPSIVWNIWANEQGMPSLSVSQQMPCSSRQVFDLLHDYSRRLEWDTMLCEARLTRGHRVAARGATSLCVGNAMFGMIGVETRYIAFVPGELAAVEMINRAPFFELFAASIRHEDSDSGSQVTYKLNFIARPKALRWMLHPLIRSALRSETATRLAALAAFLERRSAPECRF